MKSIANALPLVERGIAAGPFAPTWESLLNYRVPDWFQDVKFSLFIHWGVYSVPAFASEWYPRHMYTQEHKVFDHHVKTYGPAQPKDSPMDPPP